MKPPIQIAVTSSWLSDTAPNPRDYLPAMPDREVPVTPSLQGDSTTMTTLTAAPTSFATRGNRTDYTTNPPGAVSRNLRRLMDDAKIGTDALGAASGIGKTTVRRFLGAYEPPTNHPLLQNLSKALGKKLRRSADDVLTELVRGGSPTEFTVAQWKRINGEVGRRITPTTSTTPTSKKAAKRVGAAPAAAPSMRTDAVRRRVGRPTGSTKPKVATPAAATVANGADSLRTIVTTINAARMQGEKFVPMPVDQLTDLVTSALKARGVNPDEVLVRADFADTF